MKKLVLTACVAVTLLGAGVIQSQAGTGVIQQPKDGEIVFQPDKQILINGKLLTGTAEGIYLKKLTAEFIKRCTGKAVGCAIAAVGPNGMWSEGAAGDARRALDGSPRKMTANDKFTMASVSKTFTGLALQKQLYGKRISIDSPIGPYLPKDWKTSTRAVGNVTFRQLLTHTSGLPCNGIPDDQLKACLATANPAPSPFAYKNENFALMRILIPQINGGASSTQYANLYRDYVNQVVFAPAGLPLMQCKPTDAFPALSYKSDTANKWDFSSVVPGEIWGDMNDVCGSQGWYFSARQMAQTMRTIMTPDKILPISLVERMKKDNLAVYFGDHGNGLQSWSHGGIHPGDCTKDYCNNGEINTLIIHFNNGVSAGVIINSPYGSGGVGGDYFGDLIASVKAAG
jgi:CubicO group peptidase (beta-lactamase class C family)